MMNKKQPEIIIVGVLDGDNNVLVIRRAKDPEDKNAGIWEFPGGHRKRGEVPALAGLREVSEETGLKVNLYPNYLKLPTGKGLAFHYLARTLSHQVKPKVTLEPTEHDKYVWVPLKRMENVKPTHEGLSQHLKQVILKVKKGSSMKKRATRRIADVPGIYGRYVRDLPQAGEDLKDAILVGDAVEIFLRSQVNEEKPTEPAYQGVVERRDRNTIWIHDDQNPDEAIKSVNWKDNGDWAFVRVYRGADNVIYYVNKNPYDPNSKAVSDAKGIGLILESEPPTRNESVWALMRGETPDLDHTMGQAPQSFDRVAPFDWPKKGTPDILHQVRETLREYHLEPDVVDGLGKGRVLILTQDTDMKKDIMKVLKDQGKEIKAHRLGGLVVSDRPRKKADSGMGWLTTIPTETDDVWMKPYIKQKERKEKIQNKKKAAQMPVNTNQQKQNPLTMNQPQVNVNIPTTQKQITDLKKKYPSMTVTNNDGKNVQLQVSDPNQMQQFQQDINNPMNAAAPVMSSRQRKEASRLARGLREALKNGDYDQAQAFLTDMLRIGVRVGSLARTPIAGKRAWDDFSQYLSGVGEVRQSQIARTASRMVPVRWS